MTTKTMLDLTADTINVRDIMDRYDELDTAEDWAGNPNEGELRMLDEILEELKGRYGDEQWRGEWYPATLIRDSYFTDYATDLVKDCQFQCDELPSWIEIDWVKTAKNIRADYSSIEIDGTTYWYRG